MSRNYQYRKSKELSPSSSEPPMTTSPRSTVAPWEDAYVDSRALHGSYLELEERALGSHPRFVGAPRREMDSKDIADEIQVREIDERERDREDLESGRPRKVLL